MMKRFIPVAAAAIVTTTMSLPAFAHSELTDSTPTDGAVVKEQLHEVSITFSGKIEKGSDITVTDSEGDKMDAKELTIDNTKMTVTFDEPLDNDTYNVDWNVLSGDGHPVEGTYSFSVDAKEVAEEKEDVVEEKEEATEEKVEKEADTPKADTSDEVTSPSMGMLAAVFGGLVVVIGGGLFFLLRKK